MVKISYVQRTCFFLISLIGFFLGSWSCWQSNNQNFLSFDKTKKHPQLIAKKKSVPSSDEDDFMVTKDAYGLTDFDYVMHVASFILSCLLLFYFVNSQKPNVFDDFFVKAKNFVLPAAFFISLEFAIFPFIIASFSLVEDGGFKSTLEKTYYRKFYFKRKEYLALLLIPISIIVYKLIERIRFYYLINWSNPENRKTATLFLYFKSLGEKLKAKIEEKLSKNKNKNLMNELNLGDSTNLIGPSSF